MNILKTNILLTDLEILVLTFPSKFKYSESLDSNPNITWNILKLNGKIIPWKYINPSDNFELIKHLLEKNWKKSINQNNHKIKWKHILTLDLNMYMSSMCNNPNITMEIVNSFPNLAWDWNYLADNPNFSCEFILKSHKNRWTFTGNNRLSKNTNLTWDIILNNGLIHWDYQALSANISIPIKIICDNIYYDWNWSTVSLRLDVTWDIVKQYPNIPWNWSILSKHPNITWKIITNNSDAQWDIQEFVCNPNITLDILKLYPHWDIKKIASTDNLTWKIVKYFSTVQWNWYSISKHSNIKWKHISRNPKKPWDWEGIARNPNITWEIIQNNLDLSKFAYNNKKDELVFPQWNMTCFSDNPNITAKIVLENPHIKWNFENLARNHFQHNTKLKKIIRLKKVKCFQKLMNLLL